MRRRTEAGAALILGIICCTGVFAMAAIVVDINIARGLARKASQSADAAALAAAGDISENRSWDVAVASAKLYSKYNFKIDDSAWVGCEDPKAAAALGVSTPYYPDHAMTGNGNFCISADRQLGATKIRVLVPAKRSQTFFAGLFGLPEVKRQAAAIASVAGTTSATGSGCAICVLAPTGTSMVIGSERARIEVFDPGGSAGIYVNSSGVPALSLQNGATVKSFGTYVVGTWSGPAANFTPTPQSAAAPIADPLAFLPMPTVNQPPARAVCEAQSSGNWNENFGTGLGPSFSVTKGSCMIYPGTYASLSVSSNATLNVSPGLYVITGTYSAPSEGITATGRNATINAGYRDTTSGGGSADGIICDGVTGECTIDPAAQPTGEVTFYLACADYPDPCAPGQDGAGVDAIGAEVFVKIDPPVSGAYDGLSIFSDRNNVTPISFTAHTVTLQSGTVYAASALVRLRAAGVGATIESMLVSYQLETVGADTSLKVIYDRSVNVTLPSVPRVVSLMQ